VRNAKIEDGGLRMAIQIVLVLVLVLDCRCWWNPEKGEGKKRRRLGIQIVE
jgi:hypothetical protein